MSRRTLYLPLTIIVFTTIIVCTYYWR